MLNQFANPEIECFHYDFLTNIKNTLFLSSCVSSLLYLDKISETHSVMMLGVSVSEASETGEIEKRRENQR